MLMQFSDSVNAVNVISGELLLNAEAVFKPGKAVYS
jgi:hypothetical protein